MNRLPVTTTWSLSRPVYAITACFSSAAETSPPLLQQNTELTTPPQNTPKPRRNDRFPVRVFRRPGIYNPPAPPVSPLADPYTFLPYSKKHPKAAPSRGNELSPREWALTVNPYAQILAHPVRNDADYHRRLPTALLTRFVVKMHPETNRPWLLPDELDIKVPVSRKGTGGAQYSLGTKLAIDGLNPKTKRGGGKLWAKLLPIEMRQKLIRECVWRPDMSDIVLYKMRARVVDVCKRARLSRECDHVEGGPGAWKTTGEVMCVLDFREDTTAVEVGLEEADSLANVTPAGWKKREMPPPMDEDGLMAVVNGKRVPVHPMRRMLGDKMVEELMRIWNVKMGHPMMALMLTQRTVQVQVWLMKLRSFLGIWYAPPRKEL